MIEKYVDEVRKRRKEIGILRKETKKLKWILEGSKVEPIESEQSKLERYRLESFLNAFEGCEDLTEDGIFDLAFRIFNCVNSSGEISLFDGHRDRELTRDELMMYFGGSSTISKVMRGPSKLSLSDGRYILPKNLYFLWRRSGMIASQYERSWCNLLRDYGDGKLVKFANSDILNILKS